MGGRGAFVKVFIIRLFSFIQGRGNRGKSLYCRCKGNKFNQSRNQCTTKDEDRKEARTSKNEQTI